MAETSLATISDALELIDAKKENLKKAFDDLQSQSHSSSFLSAFCLTWSDLDAHFTSIHNSLAQNFQLLESLHSQSQQPARVPPDDPSSSSKPPAHMPADPSSSSDPAVQNPVDRVIDGRGPDPVPPRPQLVAFCESMDGIGLRNYVHDSSKDRDAIRAELPAAIRRAPDPAALVLVAMEGFYRQDGMNKKGDKDLELSGVRRSCVLLLEVLMGISPNVGSQQVGEKAKQLAMEWKGKVRTDGSNPLECLGLLHFLAAYGLGCLFEMDELIDHIVVIARYRQTMDLCRKIGLGDKIAGTNLIHTYNVSKT